MPRPGLALALIGLIAVTGTGCAPLSPKSPAISASDGGCVSNLGASPTEAERRAEAAAMSDRDFWRLIDVLGGSNSEAAYARLTKRLAQEPVDRIAAFQVRLVLALRALDDECRADWYDAHDPVGIGVSDDGFLYVRANTVSAGRATWSEASSTDTLPWGSTDPEEDGEPLLYVAQDAASTRGVSNDDFFARAEGRFDIDYETGSNPAGWPTRTEDTAATPSDTGA